MDGRIENLDATIYLTKERFMENSPFNTRARSIANESYAALYQAEGALYELKKVINAFRDVAESGSSIADEDIEDFIECFAFELPSLLEAYKRLKKMGAKANEFYWERE